MSGKPIIVIINHIITSGCCQSSTSEFFFSRYFPPEVCSWSLLRFKLCKIKLLDSCLSQVIAIVMDMLTDLHILQDLMDAAWRRAVPIYILLDDQAVPHFLDMCHRLKIAEQHLRVRGHPHTGDEYGTDLKGNLWWFSTRASFFLVWWLIVFKIQNVIV